MQYEKTFLFRGTGPPDDDDCYGGRHHPPTHAQLKGLAVKPIEDFSAALGANFAALTRMILRPF